MKKGNETRFFFIVLSNGDTIYFSVQKNDEKYIIRCYDYIRKIAGNNTSIMIDGHVIEFYNDDFILKNDIGKVICSLKNDYNKMNTYVNTGEKIEIEMLYIDADLRPKLLETEQLLCDPSATNIPGILYEPIEEQPYTRARRK